MTKNHAYTHLARVYDRFMADTDFEKWAMYIKNIIDEYAPPRGRIAETACGTGRLSIPLKKLGTDIVCCDISREMLRIAEQNARASGVHIPFVLQDMRKMDVGKSRAVVCACDGVNYLTDEADVSAFFKGAFNALVPDGIITFDISSAHKYENTLADRVFFEDYDDITYIWNNVFTPPLMQMDITIFTADGDLYERNDETHMHRVWQVCELKRLLEDAGFSHVKNFAFGGYHPPGNCDRIQFLGIKTRED